MGITFAGVIDGPPVQVTLRAHPVLRRTVRACVIVVSIAAAPAASRAQGLLLDLPLRSQRAEVSQTVGITGIRIAYHRPLVSGRTIWGVVVPYDSVWRAGAPIRSPSSGATTPAEPFWFSPGPPGANRSAGNLRRWAASS